ncbi:MAG TPA: adenylosuccinate lyase [Chloroflexota bacterium]|nr:adenylosuccinate lyase [Chloroflexota bacterium]
MIPRYTRPKMGAIWKRQAYFDFQLRVEIAACDAWAEIGVIPAKDAALIHNATFSLARIDEIEKTSDHETDSFVTAVAESLGAESRWLHLGLTSSDVLDTSQSLQLVAAADLLQSRLAALEASVTGLAVRHKDTLTIGRSHGIHAEPTTFGFKLLIWVDEIRRNRRRLEAARAEIAFGKISGSVGTHANVPPEVDAIVCRLLDLEPAPVSSQILQRDRHAHFMSTLALVATSLDKFATEVRNLQRTEIGEVEEPFEEGRHGSSSMPHKRNPSRCERVSGLARIVRNNAGAALENVTLWHERDISHSSAERVILPDSCIALDYILWLFTGIIDGLRVNEARMAENVFATHGLVFSQGVLLALIEKGMSRQDAYALVHDHAMRAFNEKTSLQDLLADDPAISAKLPTNKLDAIFDPAHHLRWIDTAYERLGLDLKGQE